MTPSIKLKANRIVALEELDYEVALLFAEELPGEPFHREYKKDKKLFRSLIRTLIKLEKDLKKHFKELAKEAPQKVDWGRYYTDLIKGSTYTEDIWWDDELLKLQVIFEGNLDDIFTYGGLSGEADLGINTGFSKYDSPTIKALKKYSLELATGLTNTTKARITESLKRSIQMGLNQEEASTRLNKVIDDPYRARVIAHTETVNAFTRGKLEVGARIGAKYKVWLDGQPGACQNCVSLHGKFVVLNGFFKDKNGNEYLGTPAHPWCKCLTKLAMDESFIENIMASEVIEGKSKDGLIWITRNGARFPINAPKGGKGTNGVGYNYKQLTGTSLKRASTIEPDLKTNAGYSRKRVVEYTKLIKSNHKIAPILVYKSDKGWKVSDGHHRFFALKKLKFDWIPTVTEASKAYGEATEADNKAIQALKK